MEKEIVRALANNSLTIATMESCTGGYLINSITNVEGSSSVTQGGYVTYSNEQKVRVGVPKSVIDEHGVYSKQTAVAMAEAAQTLTGADVTIGVTGTLSNIDPNNTDSVQGEVFFCIKQDVLTRTKKLVVPVMPREWQKKYIAEEIFKTTLAVLNGQV